MWSADFFRGYNMDRKIDASVCRHVAVLLILLVAAGTARAAEDHSRHHPSDGARKDYTRTTVEYRLPMTKLVHADGKRVDFPADIDDGRPVLVNFIYTSCTAICPVMTQIFSAFAKKLGSESARVRLVSISIDPEQDTPTRLIEYAKRYDAGPGWTFYTGTVEASVAVQKGFAAYRGDKMNHTPLTLLRSAPGKPWVRIDGFATADDLMREYRTLARAP
jgi:protein SCO1